MREKKAEKHFKAFRKKNRANLLFFLTRPL